MRYYRTLAPIQSLDFVVAGKTCLQVCSSWSRLDEFRVWEGGFVLASRRWDSLKLGLRFYSVLKMKTGWWDEANLQSLMKQISKVGWFWRIALNSPWEESNTTFRQVSEKQNHFRNSLSQPQNLGREAGKQRWWMAKELCSLYYTAEVCGNNLSALSPCIGYKRIRI